MSAPSTMSAFAPFRVRSFRFQWPADMATSWAFEMETLILGWYVLVETGSVLLFTVFASLQNLGTLLAPMFGVVGDRIGNGNLLCAMRVVYTTLATTLMILAYTDILTPVHVFIIGALMGMVRPSDMGMRAALVGETMPADRLVGAMGIQRTTTDSARIAGAITGAGLASMLGMGPAYSVIAALYAVKAKGCGDYVDTAEEAQNERQVVFFTESAELLQRFHAKTPVSEILPDSRAVVAKTADGRAVILLAVDFIRWSADFEKNLKEILDRSKAELKASSVELQMTGFASPGARQQLKALGVTLVEKVPGTFPDPKPAAATAKKS